MNEKNRNLALRVASALLLFPLLVVVTWIGGFPFVLVLALAAALGAYEVISMFQEVEAPEVFGIAGAGLLPVATWFAITHSQGGYPAVVPALVSVGVVVLLAMNLFRPGPIEEGPRRAAIALLGWMYSGLLIATAAGLRIRFGFVWLMLAFVVSWLNDILAYFAGRFFGKTPFYPKASPKKTWEGFAGGMAGSVVGAVATKAVFLWLPSPAGEQLGPIGDLAESMMKRAAGKKDSGKLIPGHGGLLDRIDALMFVLPWVYLWAALAL
jgi:phosphatidate cytidylyltransferase